MPQRGVHRLRHDRVAQFGDSAGDELPVGEQPELVKQAVELPRLAAERLVQVIQRQQLVLGLATCVLVPLAGITARISGEERELAPPRLP
jgi:hypothetical protein